MRSISSEKTNIAFVHKSLKVDNRLSFNLLSVCLELNSTYFCLNLKCDEWRDNKELFGCNRNARQLADSNNQDPNASAEQQNPLKPEENSKQSSEPQSATTATTTTTAPAPTSSADHLLIPSKVAISCALFLFAFYLA
jgi:hypothetical protein